MTTIGYDYLRTVTVASEAPCISIYQPTHRNHPDNLQDPIQFKNLVKQVEESLNRAYPTRETQALLEPLFRLQEDADFWNHTLDGLAVLVSPSRFDVHKLPRQTPLLGIVANSFHIKPLLRYVQSADRFEVLAIAEDKFALFEGNRYTLDPLEAPKVSARPPAPSDPTAQQVRGEGMAGYFRAIDQAVTAQVSKPSGAPLVLASLTENATPFRAVAQNPLLLPDGVAGVDPFALDADALRVRAWSVLEPYYLARLTKLTEDFGAAVSRQQGTGDLSDAAQACLAGRVATLLLDADKEIPGKIDPVTGAIQADDLADPEVDDQLDDLAELAIRFGAEVVLVPAERMPTQTGLAAIYRY